MPNADVGLNSSSSGYEQLKSALDLGFLAEADWGWGCFVEDYLLITGILAMLRPDSILEIGTHSGLGAVMLARAGSFLSNKAHVTSIDIDTSLAHSNLHLIPGIEEQITFLEGSSNDILPAMRKEGRSFDLVFIDGAHDYEQALKDWNNSQDLSSTFIFHDTTQFTGLQQLMREIRSTSDFEIFQFVAPPGHRVYPQLKREDFCTGLSIVQKKSNLGMLPIKAHRDHLGKLLPGHEE